MAGDVTQPSRVAAHAHDAAPRLDTRDHTAPMRGGRADASTPREHAGDDLVRPRARWLWPDVAKTVCIVLVVFQHVTQHTHVPTSWGAPPAIAAAWHEVSRLFLPLRMPLFFALSGYFASRRVTESQWRSTARAGIVRPYYLYVVWTALLALFYRFGPEAVQADRFVAPEYYVHDAKDFVLALGVGFTSTWYLFALAAYFVFCKSIARWRAQGALAIALGLALCVGWFPARGNSAPLVSNLVFFALGALHPTWLERLAKLRSRRAAAAGLSAFALVVFVSTRLPNVAALRLACGAACIAAAVPLFTYFADTFPRAANRLAGIGTRTLEIYVLHMPLRDLIELGLVRVPVHAGPWLGVCVGVLYPVALTALVVMLSMATRRALTKIGLEGLFSLPFARTKGTTSAAPLR